MEILRKSEITPLKAYVLTTANGVEKMSDEPDGSVFEVANYVLRQDDNRKTGDSMEVLTIEDEFGTLHATNSPTFIRAFFDFVDFLEEQQIPEKGNLKIAIVHGRSNSGRSFITCNPVVE